MRNFSFVSDSETILVLLEMFGCGINFSHAIKSQEAFKVVWRKSDESGTGRDESGALGTNRAWVGTNQRRTNAREAVEGDERSSSAGRGVPRGASYREGVAAPQR
jgi:hypothetical protein